MEPSGLISKIGLPGAPGRPTVELFKSLKQTYRAKSIDFLVSLIAAHLADGVLEHYVLLEEMVDGHLILCIVVLRTLEEEAQEALSAVTACTGCEVAEQHEVKTERSSED